MEADGGSAVMKTPSLIFKDHPDLEVEFYLTPAQANGIILLTPDCITTEYQYSIGFLWSIVVEDYKSKIFFGRINSI